MSGGGAARALALALLLLSRAGESRGAARTPCQALDDAYSRDNEGRPLPSRVLSVYGSARRLRVYSDGRAPSRAAAALVLASLRALLRYRHAEMVELEMKKPISRMCELAWRMQENCSNIDSIDEVYDEVVISPAISWSGAKCARFEICLSKTEVQPRLEVLGSSAASATLRLHAHLVAAADATCRRDALLWDFYSDPNRLKNCTFTRDDEPMSTLATVYILSNLEDLYTDFNNRIVAANLYLNLTLLDADAFPRTKLLRLLTERKSTFLFIDYDIWEGKPGVYKVQLPPSTSNSKTLNPMWSLRLADAFVLRQDAPQILQGLQRFLPSSSDIREVLEIEATSPELGINEAACSWAMGHNATFESWHQRNHVLQHSIAVFLCINDPDKSEYIKAANAVKNMYNSKELNIGLHFSEIDCRNEIELSNEFIRTSLSYRWKRLIGVVAPGAGARTAAELAPGVQTALVLYDAPTAGMRFDEATRATSGTLHQIVTAVAHFFDFFKWTRLVLVSDDTELAKDLFESFHKNHKLKVYNATVSGNISDTLQSLQKLNARIFFVNSNPDVAQTILCAAHILGMTSTAEYVWILREWRAVDVECDVGTVPFKPTISHFTISYWWRGGNYSQFASQLRAQFKANNILRSTLDKLWSGSTWPLLAAPLADSLDFLIKSFKKFSQSYPEKYFDLHGNGSVRLLLNSLNNHPIYGVMQKLEYVNGTLSQPLIFIDRWIGKVREPLIMWRIQEDRVHNMIKMKDFYGLKRVSDGAQFCLTNTSSELFNPPCYDFVWLIALGFLIVISLALYLSRRIRLKRLAKRDCLLTAQLLAQREFVSNALVHHYVDRAALELYEYLSQGCFGRVRYAVLRAPERQPISVAVKELRDDVPLTEESELLREACTLATLCHDHIVRLIGVCATGGPLLVLLEYAFFGNLREYLCERRHLVERSTAIEENDEVYHVSAPSLTRLGQEIASALEYLAIQRLVHRDIRASNCLIDACRTLKLADFGLARKTGTGVAGEEEYLTHRRGLFPVLWMAPESLERGVFSAASDVWALGVLLLELVTLGARPYGAWPPQRVLRYVSAGGRPPLPPDISDSTRLILAQCWRRAPEERLAAAALAARLRSEPAALQPALLPAAAPADEDCPSINDDDVTISASNA